MSDIIFMIVLLCMVLYHLYVTGILQHEINALHEKIEEFDAMYDQILMRENIDVVPTGEWGYMWLSDSGLVWTEYQPERCTSVYVSKKEFLEKWCKMK